MNDETNPAALPDSPQLPPDREASFDAFYKESRDRLLLQVYAMTGDLSSSRAAVRDAFVVAWHHWRKVQRADSPEAAVRPRALRAAVRRTTTRPWRRQKDLAPESRATLDALATLTTNQRKALVLTQLAAVSMPEMAREIGITQDAAERELQLGASQFASQREIPAASIPLLFAELGREITGVSWPRVTIIRRAGAARRRAHTLVAAVAAGAALVGSGVVVGDANGVRPTLTREQPDLPESPPIPPGPEVTLPDTSLLSEQVIPDVLTGDTWREVRTDDNSEGTGVVHFCQNPEQRYADPRGQAAWVRVFLDAPRPSAERTATQSAEASGSVARAQRAYRAARRWFSGCAVPQAQLISTSELTGTGDDAAVFLLRDVARGRTYLGGVARTGVFTTALTLQTDKLPQLADLQGFSDLLATAVDRLCTLPDAGGCGKVPAQVEARAPYPAGAVPAMVSELDLPTLGEDPPRWVAPDAKEIQPGTITPGALNCSSVTFAGRFGRMRFHDNLIRDWVLPESDLPPEVGLTQTIASLPPAAATDLVAQVRDEVDGCPDRNLGAGTEVDTLDTWDRGDDQLTVWHLVTRLPNERTVPYDVAILRHGHALSMLTFVGTRDAQLPHDAFVALAERALARLDELPPYRAKSS